MPKRAPIEVKPEDFSRLEEADRKPMTPQKHVNRANVILLCETGYGTTEIMRRGPGLQVLREQVE